MDKGVKAKRKYVRVQKASIIIRSDSEKMRQLQSIIDENEKLKTGNLTDKVSSPKDGKEDSVQSENVSKSSNDKIAQNTAVIAESEKSAQVNEKNNIEKQITVRQNLEQPESLVKKIKNEDKYEQRFCQMKAELQSFLCFWVMQLKDSVKTTQIMIDKLEKIQL